MHALISLRQYTSYPASARAASILYEVKVVVDSAAEELECLKLALWISLALLSLANFANNTFAEQGFFLQSSFFFSFSHLRMKFFAKKDVGLVKRQVSFNDDVLLEASLFGAATNMGICIVAIVEDILAPKIINTLVPLLFALWAVSDPAINSGFVAKVIFLQKRLSLPLILRCLQVVPL
nr:hypothetical protein CFP56_05984 [Quercus suber]